MKLKLRIGRQQARVGGTDEAGTRSSPAARPQEPEPQLVEPQPLEPQSVRPTRSTWVPLPRTPDERVVRAGSFCRAGDVGRVATTVSGRAVVAIRAGHCGRWVYDDRA